MKKTILTILAVIALFVSCVSDPTTIKPAGSVTYISHENVYYHFFENGSCTGYLRTRDGSYERISGRYRISGNELIIDWSRSFIDLILISGRSRNFTETYTIVNQSTLSRVVGGPLIRSSQDTAFVAWWEPDQRAQVAAQQQQQAQQAHQAAQQQRQQAAQQVAANAVTYRNGDSHITFTEINNFNSLLGGREFSGTYILSDYRLNLTFIYTSIVPRTSDADVVLRYNPYLRIINQNTLGDARGNNWTRVTQEPRAWWDQRLTPVIADLTRNTPNPPSDFRVVQNAQGGITITGYTGTSLNVVIPETISGLRVTEIGDRAFIDNRRIQRVVIPNTVTRIGSGAFHNTALNEVILGNSITHIGDQAFRGCALTSIVLPNRLVSIGRSTFYGNRISSVQLPASLRTIGHYAFARNRITNLTIPQGVIFLGDNSFGNNPITSIVIPASLAQYVMNEVGFFDAFEGNNTITRITLPANVHEINMRQFEEGLRNFYRLQNNRAGTYIKDGQIWRLQ